MRDHPRVCGEQFYCDIYAPWRAGSPPRVRGTGYAILVDVYDSGITPACAGNSYQQLLRTAQTQDHPRVCGEQTVRFVLGVAIQGSPPRVRGTANDTPAYVQYQGSPPRVRGTDALAPCRTVSFRITPACAGNSLFSAIF